MAARFTDVGEFRTTKGGKKTRFGQRQKIDTPKREKPLTPDGIALNKLESLLTKARMEGDSKARYKKLMEKSDQIRFLSMQVLAEVLIFMHNVGEIITVNTFNAQTIEPYVTNILLKQEPTEKENKKEISSDDYLISKFRMQNTFLRYVRYIIKLQATPDISSFDVIQQKQDDPFARF